MKRLSTIALMSVGSLALSLSLAACGGDEEKKDDSGAAGDPGEAPAEEEPAEEEPAEEEPAEEAGPDLSAFEGAGKLTAADGGLKLSGMTAEGGYAGCGLADGDVITMVDGAALPAGRDGATAIQTACADGGKLTVKRGEEELTLPAE